MNEKDLTFLGSYDPLRLNVLNLDNLKNHELIRVRTQSSVYYLMLVETCFDGAAVVICGGDEEWLEEPCLAWYIGALTTEGMKQKIIQVGARLKFECLVGNQVRDLDTSPVEIDGIALLLEGDKQPFEKVLARHHERVIATDAREFSTTIWGVFEGSEGLISELMMQFLRAFSRETQEVLREALVVVKTRGLIEQASRVLESERALWGNTGLALLSPARDQEVRLITALRQLVQGN